MSDVLFPLSASAQTVVDQFQKGFGITAEQASVLAADPQLAPMSRTLIASSSSSASSRLETAEAVQGLRK